MNMRLLALLATIFLLTVFESSARSAGGGGHGAAGAGHGSGESSWGYSYEHNKEPIIGEEEKIPENMDMDPSDDNLDNSTMQELIRWLENKKNASSGFDKYTLLGAGTNEIISTVGAENDEQRDAALVKTLKDHERATTKIAGAKVAAHEAYRKAGCSLPKLNNKTNDGLSKKCKELKREFNKQSTLLKNYQDELKRLRNL